MARPPDPERTLNAIPLIRRKLVPARIPDPFIQRPTLLATLHLGVEPSRRLTLVCGGPGYGKSTLVAAYLREAEVACGWYSLDESDADLATFLTYLHGVIKAMVPGLSERALEVARSAASLEAVVQTVVGLIAEELAEAAEDGGILVLDDYHAVCRVPSVLKATEFLMQYLPDNWQLILTSRETPPLSLPQMRVRQQLVEIGVRELRFTAQEQRDLLQRLSGVALSDAEALELLGHTDGWVATVILAAQAAKAGGGVTRDLLLRELGQPSALYDYLAQEVFLCQPPEVQRFLLATSLLPQVEVASCREALGFEDAAERIRTLGLANLLFAADGDGRDAGASGGPDGYAYHPSFRRFLQAYLEETLPAMEVAALCRTLGAHLGASQPDEAFALLLRGNDHAAAEALLAAEAERLLANNQLERLGMHIERFPGEYRAASWTLCFYQGEILRLWGDFDQALGLFVRAAERAPSPDHRGRALVHQAAIWLGRGDGRALELLEEGEALLSEDDGTGRGFAANLRGAWALNTNDSAAALQSYEQALACYRQLGDALGQAKVLNNLGLVYTRFGQFEPAKATYREAIAQSELAGRTPHPMTLNNLAAIYCYQGDYQQAWQAAERALDLAQLLKARRDVLYAHLALGFVNIGLGDSRRAESHFEAARDGALTIQDKSTAAKAFSGLAEVALLSGQHARARSLCEQGIETAGLPLEDPRQGDLAIQLALIELEGETPRAAAPMLDRLEREFGALNYRFRLAQVMFYQARLAAREGDAQAAEERAQAARLLADANGFDHLKAQEDRALLAALAGVGPAAQPLVQAARIISEATGPRGGVAAAISIQCFGEMQVHVGDRLLPNREWRGFKTKMILAYLLAHPDGVTKDQLTDLLYGEMDTTRTAILVLISRLRHALEPALDKQTPSRFVHFVDGRYTFNFALPYELDTQDFEYQARLGADTSLSLPERRAHWRLALEAYHGPYLAELSADSPWLTIERERFHRLAQEVHTASVKSYLAENDDAGALEAAEANLAFDACSEFAHQVKMRCLSRLGQREGALRHFQIMKQVFERELGSPPSPATQALYQSISEGVEVPLPEVLR